MNTSYRSSHLPNRKGLGIDNRTDPDSEYERRQLELLYKQEM